MGAFHVFIIKCYIMANDKNIRKQIVSSADFCDQFRKVIIRYKSIGYNINVLRQSASTVVRPITDNSFASLFNCMPIGRASE